MAISSHMKWYGGLLPGSLGGFLGGLLGVGGGVVTIPLLTGISKLTQLQAHATSLVAIAFSATVGSLTYLARGHADWRASLLLASSAIFTARLGARFAHSLPEVKLKKSFGIFLVFASLLLVVKDYLPVFHFAFSFWAMLVVFLLVGAATGFLSGMAGVGGGAIMVPAMVIIAGMSQQLAQGTSLLAMVPVAMSGAMTHYRLGNVRTDIMGGLVIGSFAGGYLGATLAATLPEMTLRVCFAGVGLWMAIKYIRTARRS